MDQVIDAVHAHANPEKAKLLMRFFKTGKGEYGEGDLFLGIMVPVQRSIAKQFWKELTLNDVRSLLKNRYHEVRLIALMILIEQMKKADEKMKKKIFDLYLASTKYINNWDLVDLSSHRIVGEYLQDKDRSILYELARSPLLWNRRISIISCFAFIRSGDYRDALALSELLLKDKHDLMHKAVGWMLREIGKKDRAMEEQFLRKHAKTMPRTMLRYAIEKFDDETRKAYLAR